jgi:WD40 repeat protein
MVFAQTLTTPHLDTNASTMGTDGTKQVHGITEDEYFPSDEVVGAVWVLKFSKDGKYLAQGGQDCTLRVWQVLGQHGNSNLAVPDYGNKNGEAVNETIKVFEDKPLHEYEGHMADILDVSWSKVSRTKI